MSGFQENEEEDKDIGALMKYYESTIVTLEHELASKRNRLKKLKIKFYANSGKPVCKCKAELATHRCFSCGRRIGPDCIGYCNEEEMSAICQICD